MCVLYRYATMYTIAPVVSLVLDKLADVVFTYAELYEMS